MPKFVNRMRDLALAKGYRIGCGWSNTTTRRRFMEISMNVESVFWKQNHYSFQREFRFVMDSGSFGEAALVMDIGNISDITLQLESSELNGELLGGKIEFL